MTTVLDLPEELVTAAERRAAADGSTLEELVARVLSRELALPQPTLDELVARITPENRHAETDWGMAVGREAW